MNRPLPDAVALINTSPHPPDAAIVTPVLEVFVALQCLCGQSYLTSTRFTSTPTSCLPAGTDVVQHVRACHHRMTVDDKHEKWLSRIFSKTIVGTAEVQQVLPPSPTAKCSCRRVYLSDFEYHWLLTEAFHNPDTLPGRVIYTTAPDGSYDIALDRRVITLRRVLDKTKVALVLIVMLVISPGLGVLVGHVSDSAEAGIAASAGFIVVASFVQGLTAWILG